MKSIEQEVLKIAVDEDGFLVKSGDWTEQVAAVLARREGLAELTQGRLDILRFMREYYRKYEFFPIVRSVCRNVDQSRNCVTEQFANPASAWKIAGLPNPGEEVITFKSWEPLGF